MSFSAGKLILFGEHSVVYGGLALVASISRGVRARVVQEAGSEKTEVVRKAIEVAGGDSDIKVKIESELPVGSGLGSSAAVASSVIKTVREYLGKPIDQDELFQLTMECEKVAHGNPSGVDPASVVYGGLIAFIKGEPLERLKIKDPIKLMLVNTGKPSETTKEMVERVANNPDKEAIIKDIGQLAERAKKRLVEGGEISQLINENGILLEKLGVVGERARTLSEQLRGLGASVKITGAGGVKTGSGMMIAKAKDFAKIRKLLDNSQIDYFETTVGEQ